MAYDGGLDSRKEIQASKYKYNYRRRIGKENVTCIERCFLEKQRRRNAGGGSYSKA